jgi:hypothetical protein
MKKSTPTNPPLNLCVRCNSAAPGYEKYATDPQGKFVLVEVDAWPLYWRDVDLVRMEFCSCQCGVAWMQKMHIT